MDGIDVNEVVRIWTHDVFLWTGFGTVVGLLARCLMPGKDRAGAFATVLMGVGGAVIGSALLAYFWEGHRITPLSPAGFLVAVAGAFVLLLFHRLLGGYIFRESPSSDVPSRLRRRREDTLRDE